MSIELGAGLSLQVPLAIGTLQWGTTAFDQHVLNSKGCISESTARDIVREVCAAGVTLFDSAEGYGGGTSEKRLGRCVAGIGTSTMTNKPILMTKFLPAPWRFTHASFEKALRASNRRLNIDCCPIYFLHSPIHYRPIEFWVESAAKCKKKGLLIALGLSNCNADEVRRAVLAGREYGVPVVVNQVLFNLIDYKSEKLQEMKRACDELNVKILAFSVIGQGLLTEKVTKENYSSNRTSRMMNLSWDSIQPLRACLKRIGENHGKKSMAQVSINWCIAHGVIPLIGCRSVAQARDSVSALEWTLTKDEVKQLDDLALSRSTLNSPVWRRAIFVVLASVVMLICRVCDSFGFGMVSKALL